MSYAIAIVAGAACLLAARAAEPAAPAPRYTTELDPVYMGWVRQPGEMLGFWMGPLDETAPRTGANAASRAESLTIMRALDGSGKPVLHPAHAGPRAWVRFSFDMAAPFREFQVFVTTAVDGAFGTGRLRRSNGALVASAKQANAREDPWLTFRAKEPMPPGRYTVEVRPAKGPVDVWPEPMRNHSAALEESTGELNRTGYGLRAEVVYEDGARKSWHESRAQAIYIPLERGGPCACGKGPDFMFAQYLGEHNNPFFIRYPKWFVKECPQAFMRGPKGKLITVGNPIIGGSNPMAAVDDPTLTSLSSQLIRLRVRQLRRCKRLRYWVMGGEEAYPAIFGLPPGDFRPASLEHFRRFLEMRHEPRSFTTASLLNRGSPDWAAWCAFREQAMADRAGHYMQDFLAEDSSRPVFYPTHGNPFFAPARRNMGHAPNVIAGMCDGFETGQITIDTDDEDLNLLTLEHLAAFGMPVVTPRLANKTLDLHARGGGRSFTPAMLRRLVYECLGMGVWHIGLVQWEGDLADGLWHIKGTPAERACKAVFGEIHRAAPVLAGMARVQPRLGLYVSDTTWLLDGWNAAWTGLYQDALRADVPVVIVNDALLDASLAKKVPVLISVDNATVSRAATAGLEKYLAAGGRLYVIGSFRERDERLAPVAEPKALGKGVVKLENLRMPETRRLVNRASTVNGAYVQERTYHPVDFHALMSSIRKHFPRAVLSPITIETGGAFVTAQPLTDGYTLLIVLINRDNNPARVTLGSSETGAAAAAQLRCRELIRNIECPSGVRPGTFTLELPPCGTALAWLYEPATPDAARAAIKRARTAVDTWKAAGADVQAGTIRLEQATKVLEGGYPSKAAALAWSVENTLGVRLEYACLGGKLRARAQVWDAHGIPVSDATVAVRLVPAPFHWHPMRSLGRGRYEVELPLPHLYDPATGTYEILHGPARLLCHAIRAHQTGGAMVAAVIARRTSRR